MTRRLPVGFLVLLSVVLFVLFAAALPGLAQDGATHAACDAITCVDKGEECFHLRVSFPPGGTAIPIERAEDVVDAIPDVVKVIKRFPWGDDVCEKYTWDPVNHVCTGSPEGCAVPEPGADECGSECFCLHPGEGVELERSSGRPFQLFGKDGPVELDLEPNRGYLIGLPIGVDGLKAQDLLDALTDPKTHCHPMRIERLNCNYTLTTWDGYFSVNFDLVPGEAYRVWMGDCPVHARLAPTGTHVRQGCRGSAYVVSGEGNGAGYSWAVDANYEFPPYNGLQDPELENPEAPGAGPGASAAEVAAALVEDIAAQGSPDVLAQVDRSVEDGTRICVLGRPMNPVLWVAPPGIPPGEGCNVNDDGDCDLEGARIDLAGFPAPVVWLDRELVHWTDTADVYDAVYGRLQPLREGAGFEAATEGCLVHDTRDLSVPHEGLDPEPGEDVVWFLVRAANWWNVGFYDQGAEIGLVAHRDAGIQASGRDCP